MGMVCQMCFKKKMRFSLKHLLPFSPTHHIYFTITTSTWIGWWNYGHKICLTNTWIQIWFCWTNRKKKNDSRKDKTFVIQGNLCQMWSNKSWLLSQCGRVDSDYFLNSNHFRSDWEFLWRKLSRFSILNGFNMYLKLVYRKKKICWPFLLLVFENWYLSYFGWLNMQLIGP